MLPDDKERLLKYLHDALIAADELLKNTALKVPKDYSVSGTKWIVERGIEIISEALKRAMQIEEKLPVTDVKKIFATRNRIAHEYDIVDPYLLYTIVQKHIPVLITELKVFIEFLETS